MASSYDEGEAMPESVVNYCLVDEKGVPVCYSVLPVQWEEGKCLDAAKKKVFLHGTDKDGPQKIFKQVIAWRVGIQGEHPDIWVLSADKKWIKLLKPRKSFSDTIRKILITVQCLHYLKRNTKSSEKSLWDHVRKVFSHFDVRASEYDLLNHLPFVCSMIKRDKALSRSPFLLKLLKELPTRKAFIEWSQNDRGDDSEGDWECFDLVCVICDNGGQLLFCDGRCLRSFHATKDDGVDSHCKSLGYTRAQVDAMSRFLCPNCQHKQHQCFACKRLGSSDIAFGAEVFPCVSATCGHFYHPKCVAKLLYPENEAEATKQERKVTAGQSFTCPLHKCVICKQVENKEVEELQFALCRRCPRSYHRKCLPRQISFQNTKEEDIIQRAWDGLIPNRILIYCLSHEIDQKVGTPIRNHIIFPETPEKEKLHPPVSSKAKGLLKGKAEDLSIDKTITKATKSLVKGLKRKAEDLFIDKTITKATKTLVKAPSAVDSLKRSDKTLSRQVVDSFKNLKTSDTWKNIPKDRPKLKISDTLEMISKDNIKLRGEENKISAKDVKVHSSVLNKDLAPLKSMRKVLPGTKVERIVSPTSVGKKSSGLRPLINSEIQKRIMLLIKKSRSSSLTLGEFLKEKVMPSTHAYSARHVDKAIKLARVEAYVEAIRTAIEKLENGCDIDDAKADCEPDVLNQMLKWRNKLKVYLAPFLHGQRYTSFGRHFTKVDKLKEIVEKLHCYVQNGDMIVDFCCGANDFSLLMKEKLEAMGKKCLFRNYDLIQPKNDFNFVKKDWMKVRQNELLNGSQLIMGLNPPFGVKAALANKFIDKALEFRPKLIILIVPKETERLDRKKTAYDLIWEDDEELSGKSFYLPGSVDVNGKQLEQWNLKPPLLYLWSRPDFTAEHKAIALEHGHRCNMSEEPHVVKYGKKSQAPNHQSEEDYNFYGKIMKLPCDLPEVQNEHTEGSEEEDTGPDKNTSLNAGELSDMSISPPSETCYGNLLDHCLPFEIPMDSTTGLDGFHGSGSGFGMAYGGAQCSNLPKDDIDNIEKRYTPSSREPPSPCNSHGLSPRGVGDLIYGFRSSDELYPSYIKDNGMDSFGPRPYNGGGVSLRPAINMRIDMSSQQDLENSQRDWYTMDGANSGSGRMGSLPSSHGFSSPAMGSSAMQRYAPHLDQLRNVRRTPPATNMPGSRSRFPLDPAGFPPGSPPPFPHHGSPGGYPED